MLALPDFPIQFLIDSNASSYSIAVVLGQNERPVAFFSKALSPAHQALSVYDREMLFILTTVKKWNSYLIGRQFFDKNLSSQLKVFTGPANINSCSAQMVSENDGVRLQANVQRRICKHRYWCLIKEARYYTQAISTFNTDLLYNFKESWLKDPAGVHQIQQVKDSVAPSGKYTW